jgi:DNA polymerase-1
VLDEKALDAMIARLSKAKLICVDTETDALDSMRANLVGLSFAVEPGHGWYVPVGHNYLGAPAQLPPDLVLSRLKGLLQDENKPKLGQHLKYDLNVLSRYGIAVRGVAFDTMLESYVLDAAGWRHDMDSMAERHLNHRTITFEDVAGKGKNQVTFAQVSVDKAAEYAAEDADITLRLHQVLYPKVAEVPALKKVLETIEMPLVPVLARVEQNGVLVDSPPKTPTTSSKPPAPSSSSPATAWPSPRPSTSSASSATSWPKTAAKSATPSIPSPDACPAT